MFTVCARLILPPWGMQIFNSLVMVCRTALASLSEKNFCLKILSSSSPPLINSVTSTKSIAHHRTPINPQRLQNNRRQNMDGPVIECPTGTQTSLTSFRVMMLGCLSIKRSRISTSSVGSLLSLLIILQSNQNH